MATYRSLEGQMIKWLLDDWPLTVMWIVPWVFVLRGGEQSLEEFRRTGRYDVQQGASLQQISVVLIVYNLVLVLFGGVSVLGYNQRGWSPEGPVWMVSFSALVAAYEGHYLYRLRKLRRFFGHG